MEGKLQWRCGDVAMCPAPTESRSCRHSIPCHRTFPFESPFGPQVGSVRYLNSSLLEHATFIDLEWDGNGERVASRQTVNCFSSLNLHLALPSYTAPINSRGLVSGTLSSARARYYLRRKSCQESFRYDHPNWTDGRWRYMEMKMEIEDER